MILLIEIWKREIKWMILFLHSELQTILVNFFVNLEKGKMKIPFNVMSMKFEFKYDGDVYVVK